MLQVTEALTQEAPVSERPSKVNDIAPETDRRQDFASMNALNAIRAGLGTSGIEHDDWDFIAHKVLDSLNLFGVLKPAHPNPRQNPNLDAVEALVRSIEPEAKVNRSASVHHPRSESGHRLLRSLAKAMEIGEAIAGIAGVEVEERRFGDSREGTIHVDIGDTEISVFFKALPEEQFDADPEVF